MRQAHATRRPATRAGTAVKLTCPLQVPDRVSATGARVRATRETKTATVKWEVGSSGAARPAPCGAHVARARAARRALRRTRAARLAANRALRRASPYAAHHRAPRRDRARLCTCLGGKQDMVEKRARVPSKEDQFVVHTNEIMGHGAVAR